MSAIKNKYGVLQTPRGREARTHRGRVYASRKEAEYAELLDLRKLAGEVQQWTPQVRIPLIVNGEHVTTYVVDFRVVLADGSVKLHEVKGYATPVWKLKRRLFEVTWLEPLPVHEGQFSSTRPASFASHHSISASERAVSRASPESVPLRMARSTVDAFIHQGTARC